MARSLGTTLIPRRSTRRVRKACRTVSEELGQRFWVGKSVGGWTPVYPDGSGQDPSAARELSAHLDGAAVHLLLHDEDVCAYFYFEDGQLVEEWMHPLGYFDGVAEEPEEIAGRLGGLFPGGRGESREQEFESWRGSAAGRTALEQLEALARLLGADGLLGAFEEIEDGLPPDGIGRRSQLSLVEPPDAAAVKRRQRSEVRAAKQELEKQGVLVEEHVRRGQQPLHHPWPVLAAANEGFILAWSRTAGVPTSERPGWICRAPDATTAALPELSSRVHRLAVGGPAQELLAAGNAAGDWSLELFDLEHGARRAHESQARAVSWVGFGPDGTGLVSLSENELTRVPLDGASVVGETTRLRLPDHGRAAAFRSSGQHLAVVTNRGGLVIVDVHRGDVIAAFDDLWERDYEAWHRAVEAGQAEAGFSHFEQARAVCSDGAVGHRLAVGTDLGVRVLLWEALLQGRLEVVARAPATLARIGGSHHRGTNACLFSPDGLSVLFAGMEGVLQRLEIDSGRSVTVVELPGRPPVADMQWSADGAHLATVSRPDLFDRRPPPPELHVWSATLLSQR